MRSVYVVSGCMGAPETLVVLFIVPLRGCMHHNKSLLKRRAKKHTHTHTHSRFSCRRRKDERVDGIKKEQRGTNFGVSQRARRKKKATRTQMHQGESVLLAAPREVTGVQITKMRSSSFGSDTFWTSTRPLSSQKKKFVVIESTPSCPGGAF